MVCKYCGAEISSEDVFCGGCGMEIENKAIKCVECGKFFNKEFGMCPFCGTVPTEGNIKTAEAVQTDETQDKESEFVVCPMCGNRYDADVGLCVVCGFSELEAEEKQNTKLCENSINCQKHNKCFSSNDGNCPFCGYTPEKSFVYEKNEETFVGKCDICGSESVLLRNYKIKDWSGEHCADMCENCITKYETANREKSGTSQTNSFGNLIKNKRLLIVALIVAVILIIGIVIVVVYNNSGYICSQCGERFHEGKSVFGEYWCNDCFYG